MFKARVALSSLRRSRATCPESKHGNAKGRLYGRPVSFRHEPFFEAFLDGCSAEWPPHSNLVAAQTFLIPSYQTPAKLLSGWPDTVQVQEASCIKENPIRAKLSRVDAARKANIGYYEF